MNSPQPLISLSNFSFSTYNNMMERREKIRHFFAKVSLCECEEIEKEVRAFFYVEMEKHIVHLYVCMFIYWITQKACHSSTRDCDLTFTIRTLDMMMVNYIEFLLLMQDCNSQFVSRCFIWFIRATAPTFESQTREGNLSIILRKMLFIRRP